jgi:hypothetical protein
MLEDKKVFESGGIFLQKCDIFYLMWILHRQLGEPIGKLTCFSILVSLRVSSVRHRISSIFLVGLERITFCEPRAYDTAILYYGKIWKKILAKLKQTF